MASYEEPLDAQRLAAEQAAERASLCDRLETMWQGLQSDILRQREESERGVDPRLQQLQLQIIKLMAQLWRMTGTPLAEPTPAPDPEAEAHDARAEVTRILRQVQERS